MPRKKPSSVPRPIGPALAFQSALFGSSCVILALMMSRLMTCSVLSSTSATPNRPITTGTRPMPSISSMRPKVSRGCAVMLSSPIRPSTMPMHAISSALAIEPWVRKVSTTRPSTIRLKYSAGPNAIATLASDGATSISATSENVPAMNEPSAEMPSAGPARPCFAI